MSIKNTILVVDDEPVNILLLRKVLEKQNYIVLTAHSGIEALELMKIKIPDLVLLDLMMPGINGYEVLLRMKSDPLISNIPVIILSAMTDSYYKDETMAAGAYGYITKPVNIFVLINAISKILYENKPNIA